MKNEMKKIEKIKKIYYSEKKSTKLHGPEVPNLILSYQVFHITK